MHDQLEKIVLDLINHIKEVGQDSLSNDESLLKICSEMSSRMEEIVDIIKLQNKTIESLNEQVELHSAILKKEIH